MDRRSLLQGGVSAIAIAGSARAQESLDGASLAEETARIIALVRQIRPGDLRKSLERDWRTDGGLQVPSPVRYVLKSCNNIQISVEFRQVDVTRSFDNPDDIITRVSKPYLESPAYD